MTFFCIQRATDSLQPEDRVLPGPAQSLRQGAVKASDNFANNYDVLQAMRFPPKSYNKELESAEDRREREAQVDYMSNYTYDDLMLSSHHTIMSNYIFLPSFSGS